MINRSVAARSPSVAGAGCCPAFVTIVRILNNAWTVVNNVGCNGRIEARQWEALVPP